MTTRDEALRALEKKYETRLANWTRLYEQDQQNDADGRWNRAHMLQCQDVLDDIRALLTTRQEVAPVAPLGFVLRDKDGGDWWPETFCIGEPEDDETDDAEWTPVYTSTGQTSDARDAAIAELLAAAKDIRFTKPTYSIAYGNAEKRLDNAIAAMQEAGK